MAKTYKTNIFGILNYLTKNKKSWNELTVDEQKVSTFMLNKWLSMNKELLVFVDSIQHLTLSNMSNKEVYELYYDVLPKTNMYFRWIKSKNEDKYNTELISLLSKHLKCSTGNVIEYLDILSSSKEYENNIREFLMSYGKSEVEIKKMI